ncbi:MAG TPA: glycosyltransferase [Acetobacteraceae bacterium]|jgi:glycosyltransferase involved in cell wall biosynthesis
MSVDSVVVLNDFCHVQGGASRVAVDEAVALHQRGLDVTFMGAVGPVCTELRDAGLRVICLDQPELADMARHPRVLPQTLWNHRAYRAMQQTLGALDPRCSVVHLHGYTKALTTAPALAARRAGFPIVCTLHDFFAACPNGAFYDYRRQQPCMLQAMSVSCALTACDKRHQLHKAYRVVRGLAQRHVAQFPASVRDYITLSQRSGALLRPYLPADARYYPLANIIDVDPARPVDVATNRALLVVGRLDAEKGVELAAEAAHRAGLPITFVGDGPCRTAVEARGARVTGWLDAAGVRRELSSARCLVFPSLWYETYGLVVAESAACGVPAIVSDIAAPAERIAHGEDGWIFHSGDLDDLIRCMTLTRDDAVIAAAGAEAFRRHWSQPPTRQEHAAALVSIYETVAFECAAA